MAEGAYESFIDLYKLLGVEPGALLGPLDEQHNVFKMYWGRATAQTFQISPPPLKPSATQPMNKAQSLN